MAIATWLLGVGILGCTWFCVAQLWVWCSDLVVVVGAYVCMYVHIGLSTWNMWPLACILYSCSILFSRVFIQCTNVFLHPYTYVVVD